MVTTLQAPAGGSDKNDTPCWRFRNLDAAPDASVRFDGATTFQLDQLKELPCPHGRPWRKVEVFAGAATAIRAETASEPGEPLPRVATPSFVNAAGAPASALVAPGGAVYGTDPGNTQRLAVDGGPLVSALPASTLPVGDYLVLTHAVGDEGAGIVFERVPPGASVASDKYWFTPRDARTGLSAVVSIQGATSGTVALIGAYRDRDPAFVHGAGDPATYGPVSTALVALVGGVTRGGQRYSGAHLVACKFLLALKPTVALVVPVNGVVRVAVYE
jgi:hypothetical protein